MSADSMSNSPDAAHAASASTMSRRQADAALLAGAAFAALPTLAQGANPATRPLPRPRKSGGMPLLDALARRRSTREYSGRPLPPQVLSDLLWAAYGINRPSGDRTAPYWR
ncbi:MAG: hypothetical protein WCB48_15660, partial [Casimicrobiaceae bacterium]